MTGSTPCTVLSAPPPIVAICGHPRHGKSTVQGFLNEDLGVIPMDDGLPIRLEGMKRFGLTWEQVSTQAGKLDYCQAFGREMEVREALGLIGKEWEESDLLTMPKKAVELLREKNIGDPVSFGSVRRGQASIYRDLGGLVIEVYDPRKPLSQYDFDYFDPRLVHTTIINDGTFTDLRRRSVAVVRGYLENYTGGSWI